MTDNPMPELPNDESGDAESPSSDGPYPSGQATGVSNTLWRPSPQYEEYNGLTHTKAATSYDDTGIHFGHDFNC